jgi:hypothetical protein
MEVAAQRSTQPVTAPTMSITPRALLIGTAIGTVLQTAMVVAGHSNRAIAKLFAVGGMSLSLIAGVIYAMLARGGTTGALITGGVLAGAICAFIGIAISYFLKDVPASLMLLGTLSSAVTGAIGGWLGSHFMS